MRHVALDPPALPWLVSPLSFARPFGLSHGPLFGANLEPRPVRMVMPCAA